MNGISYPHVQVNIQVCFICMEVEGYEQQRECCFLFIIHLVLYFAVFAFPVITYVLLTSTHFGCALTDPASGVNFE